MLQNVSKLKFYQYRQSSTSDNDNYSIYLISFQIRYLILQFLGLTRINIKILNGLKNKGGEYDMFSDAVILRLAVSSSKCNTQSLGIGVF